MLGQCKPCLFYPLEDRDVFCDHQRTRLAAELYELSRLKCGERFACLCPKDLLLGTETASGKQFQKHEMATFNIPPAASSRWAVELNDAKKCSRGIVSRSVPGPEGGRDAVLLHASLRFRA
jgi:hypothetical protein